LSGFDLDEIAALGLMNLRGRERMTLQGVQRHLPPGEWRLGDQGADRGHFAALGATDWLMRQQLPALMSTGKDDLFARRATQGFPINRDPLAGRG